MNINITVDDTDTDKLDAFAAATAWRDNSGIDKSTWLNQKVAEWITQKVTIGSVLNNTADQRTAYVAAVQSARVSAAQTITDTPITIGTIDGGGIIRDGGGIRVVP